MLPQHLPPGVAVLLPRADVQCHRQNALHWVSGSSLSCFTYRPWQYRQRHDVSMHKTCRIHSKKNWVSGRTGHTVPARHSRHPHGGIGPVLVLSGDGTTHPVRQRGTLGALGDRPLPSKPRPHRWRGFGGSKLCTFQIVLTWTASQTFVCYFYDLLQWTTGPERSSLAQRQSPPSPPMSSDSHLTGFRRRN